jgi:hypothetical protein
LFGSEDISLEGLQQELEECESDEVSYSLNWDQTYKASTSVLLFRSIVSTLIWVTLEYMDWS